MSATALPITAVTPADASLLAECAAFLESMLHRFLKTESQKPTPPTPAELQPAVMAVWRLSTIRKNLAPSPKPSKTFPPPTSSNCNSSSVDSVSSVAPCEPSPPPAPTIQEVFDSIELVEKEIRRVQREMKSRAAQSEPPIPSASPPQFRYPPPKRTSV